MLTETAIKYFGTRTALAKALGIRAPSTYNWGEKVPQARQYELERITNGELKAEWPPTTTATVTAAESAHSAAPKA